MYIANLVNRKPSNHRPILDEVFLKIEEMTTNHLFVLLDHLGVQNEFKANGRLWTEGIIPALDGRESIASAEGKRIAETIVLLRRHLMEIANANGANFREVKNYVTNMVFDDIKMKRQEWINLAKATFDINQICYPNETTGVIEENPDYWLVELYFNIMCHQLWEPMDMEGFIEIGAQTRRSTPVLHIAYNPGGWEIMDKEFGTGGNYYGLFIGEIHRLVKQGIMFQSFGPNPRETWAKVNGELSRFGLEAKEMDRIFAQLCLEIARPSDPRHLLFDLPKKRNIFSRILDRMSPSILNVFYREYTPY